MLLKFCVVILLILFPKIILLCDADEARGKDDTTCVGNSGIPFKINTRRFKRHDNLVSLNATSVRTNSSSNKIELRGFKGRFLNEYFVITCDGHVLSTFRMVFEHPEVNTEKCPVLLVHGLFQSSDTFFEQDKDQSLALKLQNLGYDVWLANTRASKYNRVHLLYEPEINVNDVNRYFSYSYEEIGTLDIAATVDFILSVTTHKKLIYIGHSLGGTSFLALNSLKPDYNSKFATAYLFAPLGYHRYFPNDILKAEANRSDDIFKTSVEEGIREIFPYKDDDARFSPEDCLGNKSYSNICNQLNIQTVMGLKTVNNNVDETRGGSLGPLFHLAQNVKSGTFRRWDSGEFINLKKYRNSTPPNYDLGLVTVPTKIIYAPNDEFVSPKDIANMASQMGNAEAIEVKKTSFKHEDFIMGPDAMENVYAGIIDELERSPNLCKEDNSSFSSDLLAILMEYKWAWISILLIILAIAVVCLCACNKKEHERHHCRVHLRHAL
ncbi:lipase 1-like [Cydia splendana]|uniref:lipase 1-like n=1 Tax=Cydia splendana TaxID=1100963 RepID=UPI0028F4B529